jgi:hypothetical protein
VQLLMPMSQDNHPVSLWQNDRILSNHKKRFCLCELPGVLSGNAVNLGAAFECRSGVRLMLERPAPLRRARQRQGFPICPFPFVATERFIAAICIGLKSAPWSSTVVSSQRISLLSRHLTLEARGGDPLLPRFVNLPLIVRWLFLCHSLTLISSESICKSYAHSSEERKLARQQREHKVEETKQAKAQKNQQAKQIWKAQDEHTQQRPAEGE